MQSNKKLTRSGILWGLFIVVAALVLSACGGGGVSSTPAATGPGTLQLEATSYSVSEGTATVTVTVTRTGSSDGAVSVDYATADDSATSTSDYTAVSGTLNWADGVSTSQTVDITIADDNDIDPSESFTIALSNVSTASLGTNTSATVNITDVVESGTLQVQATSYSVTEGTATVTVSVTRTGGIDGAASVDYATVDGTAASGDYTTATSTLNWAAGDSATKTVDVTIADDSTVELTEALTVTLSNASIASLGTDTSATVSIADNDSTPVTGTVSAPNGAVAFNGPSFTDRMLAALLGNSANAAIGDFASAVGGVTVNVYQINADGTLVSTTPITTATTDSFGAYVLAAPLDAPASKYIIRAEGSTGTLESRITAATVDVDPVTDATSLLVVYASSDLTNITTDEIVQMQDEVGNLVEEIDSASLTTATALSDGLETAAKDNEEINNVVTSSAASGTICGTVTNSSGAGVANIRIVARDFGNWVTRAKTKTDSSGAYCLNVPVAGDTDTFTGGTLTGEYILGAFNRTGDSNDSGRHASEWWSTGGTAYNQFDAEKISVPDTTTVSGKNFQLELGARITGSVTASDTGAFMEGVKVIIRDFDNRTVLTSARVKADGTYRVNVIPGKYLVVARNKTVQPYASEVYDASTGTNNRNLGLPVTVTVGEAKTVDFALEAGSKLSGTITDGATSNLVKGMRVMINNSSPGGPADRLRTNKQGKYRIWLRPDTYKVYAYGQRNLSVDLNTTNQTVDFSGAVNAITATLQDSGGNPVSQAKFRLYDTSNTYLGFEISNSDGSVTMYTDQIANVDHRAQIRLDSAASAGSIIYDGVTQLGSASPINVNSSDVALNTITLPGGGVLTGTVYAGTSGDTSTPTGNFSIEVRDGATDNTGRFTRITTRGDGSYVLTLPAGTYERVKMRDADSGAGFNCDGPLSAGIDVTAGLTTTLNFYDGDNTCELNP